MRLPLFFLDKDGINATDDKEGKANKVREQGICYGLISSPDLVRKKIALIWLYQGVSANDISVFGRWKNYLQKT